MTRRFQKGWIESRSLRLLCRSCTYRQRCLVNAHLHPCKHLHATVYVGKHPATSISEWDAKGRNDFSLVPLIERGTAVASISGHLTVQ